MWEKTSLQTEPSSIFGDKRKRKIIGT
jgi:hypothetical protein